MFMDLYVFLLGVFLVTLIAASGCDGCLMVFLDCYGLFMGT